MTAQHPDCDVPASIVWPHDFLVSSLYGRRQDPIYIHDRLRHPRYRIREPRSFFQPSLLFCLNRYSPREFSTDFCVCCPHAMKHARFCVLSILNSVLRSIVRRPRTLRQSKLFWAKRTFTHQRAHSAQTTRQKASTDPHGNPFSFF
jgi:hypothetical protein